jgi:glycerol transport system ATP-binding protein
VSVALDHATRTVSGVPYQHEISLTLERGKLNVLLGPTLSGTRIRRARSSTATR